MDLLVQRLKAAGEPSRLRILSVLTGGELTVSELCRILGQSQPRVSRHLRLLVNAGLLERHAEGTNAYYRTVDTGSGAELLDALLALVDDTDPALARDRERLVLVKQDRADSAAAYFASVADEWDRLRGLHIDEAEIEAQLADALGPGPLGRLLDLGTGTGRMLEVFADRMEFGLGVDSSAAMLGVARSRLDDDDHRHCSVRQGDVHDLAMVLGNETFDVVVMHQVLHFLDDPARAVSEAAAVLAPGGRLVVVDFSPHEAHHLRTEFAHHWLGFADSDVEDWCVAAGLEPPDVTRLPPRSGEGCLTTTIWMALYGAQSTFAEPMPASFAQSASSPTRLLEHRS